MHNAQDSKKPSLASNLAWATGGPVARMASQLLCQVVLARLLAPADYGVFSVALIIATFATFLSEAAGAAVLVKNPEISTLDIRANFTLQLIVGLLTALGLFGAAPLIADFLHKQEVVPVLRVMAINCLLTMAGVVSMRLLSRQMRFKQIQSINVGGYLLGYVVIAIPMAYLGFGVWALVAAWFAQSCTVLIAGYLLVRHSLVPYLTKAHVLENLRFGFQTFLAGILNFGVMSIDRLVVAKFNSPAAVGIYTNAYNLATAPIWAIVSSLQQVLFSNASKEQSDNAKLLTSYRKSLILVSALAIPAFFTLASASAEVVLLLYGAKWSEAAQIVTPLALAMPFYAINGVSTPLMWAKGRVTLDISTQAVTLACLFAGLLTVSNMPPVNAAWVVFAVYVGRALFAVVVTSRLLAAPISLWRLVLHWLAIGAATLAVQHEGLQAARLLGAPSVLVIVLSGLIMVSLLLAQLGFMAKFGNGLGQEFGHAALARVSTQWRKIRTSRKKP